MEGYMEKATNDGIIFDTAFVIFFDVKSNCWWWHKVGSDVIGKPYGPFVGRQEALNHCHQTLLGGKTHDGN
jgi:hypothetical protein